MKTTSVRVGIIGLGEASVYHSRSIRGWQPPQGRRKGLRERLGANARHLARRVLRGPQPPSRRAPLAAVRAIEGVEIVAVSDLDNQRFAWFANSFNLPQVRTYTDYRELIAQKDIDAVVVCTPQSSHAEIVIDAARHGKHIFCEKPMAMTSEECLRMIDATDKAGVVLQIGYVLRFSSEHGRIRDAILSGELGRPVFMQTIMSLRAGSPQRWVYDEKLGGGILWEYSHGLDLLRQIFGDPDTVFAIGGRYKPEDTSAMDTIAVSLTFPSGDRALFADSYALRGFGWEDVGSRPNRMEIDVIGPKGVVQFPDADRSWRVTARIYGNPTDRIEKSPLWTSIWGANGYRQEMEHFIESVRNGKPPALSGREGLRTVQLLEAIQHSVRTGEAVKFADWK